MVGRSGGTLPYCIISKVTLNGKLGLVGDYVLHSADSTVSSFVDASVQHRENEKDYVLRSI